MILTRSCDYQCSLPSLTAWLRCVMTNLAGFVPTLLHRQLDTLLSGLVVTLSLVVGRAVSARADPLTHSLTLLLVTKPSIIIF